MQKLPLVVKIISTILMISYPFIIFLGLSYFSISSVAIFIIAIAILRYGIYLLSQKNQTQKTPKKHQSPLRLDVIQSLIVISFLLALGSFIFQSLNWMLFYPICVNLILLINFSYSLIKPPSMIERFARLRDKELPPEAVYYTRNVTKIWCLFFISNGTISFLTIYNIEYWTLYNGFISYLLIGLLLGGEYIYRIWKIRAIKQ